MVDNIRSKSIGGSDTASVLGVSRYKSPFQLYLEKIGEFDSTSNSEACYWGNQLEEIVAQEFVRRSGKTVRRARKHYTHKKYNFLTGNIDRKIVGENAFLECKTVNQYKKNEWDNDEVPLEYLAQCMHYLAVTDFDYCYIAALIGGQYFTYKKIERNENLIEKIIEKEFNFWNEFIQKKVPPMIDGTKSSIDLLKSLYPRAQDEKEIELTEVDNGLIDQRNRLKENKKSLEEKINVIENEIKLKMEDAEFARSKNYIVTWKNVNTKRIDTITLKKELPDVYSKFSKESQSRRFNIKEIKEVHK